MTPTPPDGKLFSQEVMDFVKASALLRGPAVRMRERYAADGYDKMASDINRLIARYDKALTALRKKVQAEVADDL